MPSTIAAIAAIVTPKRATGDVSDSPDGARVIAEAHEAHGPLDILVNVAPLKPIPAQRPQRTLDPQKGPELRIRNATPEYAAASARP